MSMCRKSLFYYTLVGICSMMATSCTTSSTNDNTIVSEDTLLLADDQTTVLVSDEELEQERAYNVRADELFDDFLYNYVHDEALQLERTKFPLPKVMLDGTSETICVEKWENNFAFMDGEFTTTLYNNEEEKGINEDTHLELASVERIDLVKQLLTSYDFVKDNGKWKLKTIRDIKFTDSDLSDFLIFYSKFTKDPSFQKRSLARSIHISMMDPNDDAQTIEGFVTRDQWSTVNSGIPEGVISNIRYGQKYAHAKKLLMEKISLGDGMSETFHFAKNGARWELVGYEN